MNVKNKNRNTSAKDFIQFTRNLIAQLKQIGKHQTAEKRNISLAQSINGWEDKSKSCI